MTTPSVESLRPLVEQLYAELDPEKIGEIYCDYGGLEFWRERRDAVSSLGMDWAEALCQRLKSGGSSFYVGAGIAELPAMLAEVKLLGRSITACNLRIRECAEINRVLDLAGIDIEELRLLPEDAQGLCARREYDHLGLVSVLDDPELYPQVSCITYGRLSPVLIDMAALQDERERLEGLVAALLGKLQLPAWITTSIEEVPWIMHWAGPKEIAVEADDEVIETAVVGDPIGFLSLRQ
ncbi:MAG: hypothetical protein ACYTG5_10155 [Planctomycetota bacterium]